MKPQKYTLEEWARQCFGVSPNFCPHPTNLKSTDIGEGNKKITGPTVCISCGLAKQGT